MKRFTPEEVLKAYEVTGLEPTRMEWHEPKTNCACGVAALTLAEHSAASFDHEPSELAAKTLKTTQAYVDGFVTGFDDWCSAPDYWEKQSNEALEQYNLGIEDGEKAWDAVRHLSKNLENLE